MITKSVFASNGFEKPEFSHKDNEELRAVAGEVLLE